MNADKVTVEIQNHSRQFGRKKVYLENWKVAELKKYLQGRGISCLPIKKGRRICKTKDKKLTNLLLKLK